MKFLNVLFVALLSAAVAFWVSKYVAPTGGETAQKETAFERVMRTGTLRCAYASLAPMTIVDPNTKKVSGIFGDIIEEMGRRLNLKIDWAEEVGYGNINTGFETGRYDAFCSLIWPDASRAASALFTMPLFHSPVYVWVRADDHRFDGNITKLNDQTNKIAVMDGDVSQGIAKTSFPKAQEIAAPQSANVSDLFQMVLTGKADAMSNDPLGAKLLMAQNPGALRNADAENPVRVFDDTFMLPFGEHDLKATFDTVLSGMIMDGSVEKIIRAYVSGPLPYYLPSKKYILPGSVDIGGR